MTFCTHHRVLNLRADSKEETGELNSEAVGQLDKPCELCHKYCIRTDYGNHWLCDTCDVEGVYLCTDTDWISRCDKCSLSYLKKN